VEEVDSLLKRANSSCVLHFICKTWDQWYQYR